jgi:secretion/DNA translocation related TadE-like protein
VAAVGLVAAYAWAALTIGSAVLARHRAGAAADFAALAAAAHADPDGGGSATDDPCAWAERAVRTQGATLVACRCDGEVCEVRAAVPTPWGSAAVASRAGPTDAGDATVEVRP